LKPLPEELFGTQAPNATTVLFALVVFITMIVMRRQLSDYWLRSLALAVASAMIVGVKNYVQEVVVSPDRNTPASELQLIGTMLEWVSIAQVAVAVLYIVVSLTILQDWPDRWRSVNALLFTAAVASAWAALASAEWASTFHERAQQSSVGDYEPVSQLLHIALVAILSVLAVRTLVLLWRYYRVPRSRRH
jgi:hypothetical protein